MFVYLDDEDQISDDIIRNRLLQLHFLFIKLVQEVKFPQWYTETEITALEKDFIHFAHECNWLQDALEELGVCPGEGMNIIKFHDFLSIPGLIREFGCMMNLDTGTFERRMKHVKRVDEQTKKTRSDDGREHVFLRSVAQDQDDRYQAWKASSSSMHAADDEDITGNDDSDVDDYSSTGGLIESSESEQDEQVFRFSDATLNGKNRYRKAGGWLETKYMLERGSNGPAVDVDEALTSFYAGEDISAGLVSFFVRERITHVDPTTLLQEGRYLFPGHCVQLKNSTFAQVLLPRVWGKADDEDMDTSRARMALLMSFVFVDEHTNGGNHLVLPIPLLRRGVCFFGRLHDILRRVHIVPVFRPGRGNSATVKFSETFVVNPFVFKVRRGPYHPPVCLCCPYGCPGKGVLMPSVLGSKVRCTNCKRSYKWL